MNKDRNTAILLVAAGSFMLLGGMLGYLTVSGLLLIWFGIHKVRFGGDRKGFVLIMIGCLLLLNDHFFFIFLIILLSLGYFYMKSKQAHHDDSYLQKKNILGSVKWDKDPWVLKNMSMWSIIGELHLDLSLALIEEPETVVILQGVIADVEIIVPLDIGLKIEASVLFGQLEVGDRKESGVLNKVNWTSPNYATSEQRVNLMLSYVVGNINIKII